MEKNSAKLTYTTIVLYLVTIFSVKKYMETKKPFNLKYPLIAWNLTLAIFSFMGSYRCLPVFIRIVKTEGWRATVCSNSYYSENPESFWVAAFTLSKFPELLDTLFIVLRKRKLIFLHWYHHTSVLAFGVLTFHSWYGGPAWYGTMNYSIHAVMYLYYAVMATKLVRIPKWIAMVITSLQLSQMVVGLGVQYVLWLNVEKSDCHTDMNHVLAGLCMYGSYFLLFLDYFLGAYVRGKNTNKEKTE